MAPHCSIAKILTEYKYEGDTPFGCNPHPATTASSSEENINNY